jgi:hypothetical protein
MHDGVYFMLLEKPVKQSLIANFALDEFGAFLRERLPMSGREIVENDASGVSPPQILMQKVASDISRAARY